MTLLLCGSWGCGRGPRTSVPPVSAVRQAAVSRELHRFSQWWLAPARLPPPSLSRTAAVVVGDLSATAEVVVPEDADWNQWPDGVRLFNNRAAVVFRVVLRHQGGDALSWRPDQTFVEVNRPGNPLPAASTAEDMLRPLISAALQQERWVLEGDLVARTRGAGAFRAAYLPAQPATPLDGLVAFAVPPEWEPVPVGALRLRFAVEGLDEPLVFVFD